MVADRYSCRYVEGCGKTYLEAVTIRQMEEATPVKETEKF